MGVSLSQAHDCEANNQLLQHIETSVMTSRLIDAIQREDIKEMDKILSIGGHLLNKPETDSIMGYTPLQVAIQYNKIESIIHLLSYEGISINGKSLQFHRSALMIAAEFIFHPLTRTQNNMNEENQPNSLNCNHYSCDDTIDSDGGSMKVSDNAVNVIELLIQRGARCNDKDSDRLWTALHYAAYANNTYAIQTLLFDRWHHSPKQINLNHEASATNTRHDNYTNSGDRDNNYISINAQDEYGQTPLMVAVMKDNVEAVRCLLNITESNYNNNNNNNKYDKNFDSNSGDNDYIKYRLERLTIDFSIKDRDGNDVLSLTDDCSCSEIKQFVLNAIEKQQQQQQQQYDERSNVNCESSC